MTGEGRTTVYLASRRGLRTRVAERVSRRAREQRRRRFRRLVAPAPGERLVDVGCGQGGLAALEPELDVTGVDRTPWPSYAGPFVQADASELPFADGEFDVVYSNSLLEHVVEPERRRRAAGEIRRVGRRYFVQTPNRWFPVEPHALLPLVHWLPRPLGRRLWPLGVSPHPYEGTRLIGARELRELFPDARIVRERLGPLTKSLLAVGPERR
jgi:SAM-dependent methyltransferase